MNIGAKERGFVTHDEDVADVKPVQRDAVGTVRLLAHSELVLIPTPSPDPKGECLPVSMP